jgi:acyl-coenzyme A synthetase/AMP-(fatty) acid ligase
VKEIPKTRSGKILRRILRDILINPNLKNYGDTSTILNSE